MKRTFMLGVLVMFIAGCFGGGGSSGGGTNSDPSGAGTTAGSSTTGGGGDPLATTTFTSAGGSSGGSSGGSIDDPPPLNTAAPASNTVGPLDASPVPEPVTTSLVILGLGALAMRVSSRRNSLRA